MAFANPAIDPPRLPSPTKQRLHSRSPSRSPVRQYNPRDHDIILRDLSPTTTLRAFSKDPRAQSPLGRSLEHASPGQRALGAKAARACLDLRGWAQEIEAWEWPGTFEVPEPVRKKQRISLMSLGSLASRPSMSRSQTQESEELEEEYWGSLPVATVRRHEQRLDDISRSLEDLDVEELKDFVLSAHSQSSFGGADIDDNIGAIGADTNLRHLDDFTALITATILSALPYLSRLTRLLHTWHIRLTILQSTPSYLKDLRQAKTDLDHGWAALAVSKHPAADEAMRKSNASFTRDTMAEMKDVISTQVHSLGRRLDKFLDELEGRQETVPERWIEEFEELEEQYGSWVVQAERKVIEGEWVAAQKEAEADIQQQSNDRAIDNRPRTATSTPTMIGPTITTATTVGSGSYTSMNTSTHTTTSGPTMTSVTTVLPHSTSGEQPRGRDSSPVRDRPRHVPIVVDQYISNPDQPTPMAELPTTTSITTATRSISPLPRSNTPKSMDGASSANVKKRAAFLNGEIENDGLIKSKPAAIVRPFERASNAFTRLFKEKEGSKDEEQAVDSANVSRKSSRDASLSTPSGPKAKTSSTSLKGILGMDKTSEKRSRSIGRGSRVSTTSSGGSKRATSSTGRLSTERMECGDLARPRTPKSEGSRSRRSTFGSKKSPGKARDRGVMEYGDMVRIPDSELREIERQSRAGALTENARPRSSGKSKAGFDDADLAAFPLPRKSEESSKTNKEKRPGTPKRADIERSKAKEALEYGGLVGVPMAAAGHTNLSGSQPLIKTQPHYMTPVTDPIPKRTSRQNVTALPHLQTSGVGEPQTYQPSGLNSPFHSPIEPDSQGFDVPENWPLSNIATPRETPSPVKEGVIRDSGMAITSTSIQSEPTFGANAFDRQFIHTIPAEPIKRPISRDRGKDEMVFVFKDSPHRRRVSGEVIPLNSSYDEDDGDEEDGAILWTSKSSSDRSWMRTGVPSTSTRLDLQDHSPPAPARSSSRGQATAAALQNSLPRPVSMVEEAEEEDLSSADDSEEEFGIKRRSDNAAGYFGSPRTNQSRSGANSATKDNRAQRANSNPPISPGYLKIRTMAAEDPAAVAAAQARSIRPDDLLRRASTASVESHSHAELKTVDIVKRSSIGSPRGSAPTTPLDSRRASVEEANDTIQTPTSPLQYKGGIVFPSPPSVPPRASSLRASPEADKEATKRSELAVAKRKQGAGRRELLSSSRRDLEPGEDNFDRHVSEVLDRVHAPIRFRTRPGAETPLPGQNPSSSKPSARLPKANERPGKNMTLAPAESSPRKATPADPEVKLYHLTQTGRAEPIKLYVRLVGEGERVMVRVGGGWADLADYLRQYAEHHGSRTVSEGTLELQTASAANANGTGSSAKRTFSGPLSALGEPKSATREAASKTPTTPLSIFPPLERPRTRDSEKSWLSKDQPEFTMGDSDAEEASSPSLSYSRDIAPPRRSSLLSSSRPSTAQSVRPSDGSLEVTGGGPGGGLSLAGPSKSKTELPEQKARWVEGMIQQVNKSASAEKSREEKERYVAEMGKVGGVRRVAFRSASGAQ